MNLSTVFKVAVAATAVVVVAAAAYNYYQDEVAPERERAEKAKQKSAEAKKKSDAEFEQTLKDMDEAVRQHNEKMADIARQRAKDDKVHEENMAEIKRQAEEFDRDFERYQRGEIDIDQLMATMSKSTTSKQHENHRRRFADLRGAFKQKGTK